ncbi:MAG: NAD(P)/FAD-dependent oxidoreductase [Bacteroidota bacterium]
MNNNNDFEVIIIGGSYAGLSAAMALGRSLRRVLIIDSGLPCNRQTPYSHNFITQDGATPFAIAQKAKEQVLNYSTVIFLNGLVTKTRKNEGGFTIKTQAGEEFKSRKLILATGVKDVMPAIKGFYECWGISVVHCPYCHGYEFRNKKTGIMANGERAFHLASLVNNLTNDIQIFTSGKPDFSTEQITKLNNQKIKIIETSISEIEHENGSLKSIVLNNGHKEVFNVLYAAIPFQHTSDISLSLGCEFTEMGHVKVDMFQKTTVNDVFACGDNSSMMRSVAYAVSTGNITGAMVNKELTEADFN